MVRDSSMLGTIMSARTSTTGIIADRLIMTESVCPALINGSQSSRVKPTKTIFINERVTSFYDYRITGKPGEQMKIREQEADKRSKLRGI